jgi:hypothetical protein
LSLKSFQLVNIFLILDNFLSIFCNEMKIHTALNKSQNRCQDIR